MSSPALWQAHTPEAKLPRSDSRLASATCKGICSNGRPCRRPLAPPAARRRSSAQAQPSSPMRFPLYCWQHQDQASAAPSPNMRTKPVSHVRQQSSIDTLFHRIGDLDIAKGEKTAPPKAIPVPQDAAPPRKKPGFFALLCCGGLSSSEGDYYEVVGHKKRPEQSQRQPEMTVRFQQQPLQQQPRFTSRMRNCIPTSLPAHTAGMLQSELSKPLSTADEPGYIYMFWIEEDATPPVKDVVHSLVDNRSPRDTAIPLPSPILPNGHKQIMVKIGRATNVHRRLSSWSRQCGYNLSLLRFYPHVSDSHMAVGSTNPSPAEKGIRKVPFSHRVERLIHIELAGRRVKQGKCNACGREHREWFAIDATRAGVRDVDEVIQRWVRWAETQPALT